MLVFIVVSGIVCATLARKYKKFKLTIVIAGIIFLVGLISFGLALWTEKLYLVLMGGVLLGIGIAPGLTIIVEFCCEVAFPIPEGIVTGFLEVFDSCFSIFFALTIP